MPRSSLPMEMGDTPPARTAPWPQLGDGRTPLLGKRMCLRPVAFQGCGEASGHGLGGGWARLGVGTLQGSRRSIRDCLALKKLKLSRQ